MWPGTDFPQEHLDFLSAKGIDIQGIQRADGPTFRWGGRYHASMNRRDTLFTELGVFENFEPKLPEAYRDSELVFLANIHPSLQLTRARADQVSAVRRDGYDELLDRGNLRRAASDARARRWT